MDRIGKIVALVLSAIILFAAPALAWQEIPELPFDERGDKAGLLLALDRQAEYLARLGDRPVKVGALRVPASKLAAGVTTLRKIVDESFGKPDLSERVNAAFRIFRTSHPAKPGRAHLTGYYDPIVEASHTRSGPYIHPLYARPPDLEESGGRAFRRVSGEAHPYFTRAQIEDGALAGRGLEIAWVKDYVGLHFLHIQGSGTLRFPDGSTASVHVAGTNGYDFQSPGRMLIRAGLSSGAYEDVQRVLRADIPRARRYLTQNPRFIFFRMDDKPTSGSAGVPLTPGRTIATDKRVYEAGAIGYVRYDAPRLASDGTLAGYASTSRFVLDQDTGNAIVGPGRADLYIGAGPLAEKLAGATNTHGELYFLIPR